MLGVTEPFSCGLGGGGFMVIRPAHGKVITIDGRETAPEATTSNAFIDPATGQPLAFNDARWSGLSVGVPGTPATWDLALKKYGTMKLKDVLKAGINVARNGFVVDQTFFDQTQSALDWFNDIPTTAALYLDPDGTPHDVGTTFRNPDLAHTYELIAKHGVKELYKGEIAPAIVNTVQHPNPAPTANHVWRPGVMTLPDLKDYRAPERKPTHVKYRGLDVYSMGPPSSGGSTVGEALNILEGYNLASMPRDLAFHYFLEASRYSFADRNAYLADPDYYDVPLEGPAVGRLRGDAPGADHDDGGEPAGRRAGRPVPVRQGQGFDWVVGGDDDAPRDVGQEGQRRLVHVHDRVDRRLGPPRSRLRLPAQQRADRLQLHAPVAESPRRRQAAAQLDGADDRPEEQQAVPVARLTRRRDDHHDRAADPVRPPRRGLDAAAGDRRPAREPAQRDSHRRRAGVPLDPAAHAAGGARPPVHERG